MPLLHGRNSRVYFNSADLSGFLSAADVQTEVDNSDTSTFLNDGYRSNMAGLQGHTYSFDGFHDASLPLPAAMGVDAGVLSVGIGGGATVGDPVELASITSTSLGKNPTMDGAVAISWAAQATGHLGLGQVLHPNSEDTNTTTGSSKDDGASTSAGWTAHLHVFLVDGGSWVVKVQDSADNSSWADVSGLSFTAATGVTQQRLVSASATATLRRYVRAVATRTGGSAGQGITYFLGYARNGA